ncbi:pentatricopeptide repeat-containing protein At4g14820-like [Phragmites australis]|uniref:pentatricopeptide repeat-containing protein At4g14820-like n=1 Tax=Phragmites australis TaxID=29695 RepID=UPI002D76B817|nr:pentatricopeptide repeat-containing protein At4g14820-like [Phragmites australis]XP_062234232.1 pentatricopeptide repeat-containing protein At4g14820-like [Phragmites australis]XP_062234233.1 pentatricopeptide repeat-containing protein At4g14820-like [Phragmites australis]
MSATTLRTGAAILRALSAAPAPADHLHAHALKLGVFPSCLHLCSALLKSYAASGRVAAARQLFDEIPHRDVPLWNALVSAYTRSGHPHQAVQAVSAMARAGSRPNGVSVTSLLSACAQMRSPVHGRELHGYAVRNVPVPDLPMLNALVTMYGKCERLADARTVFVGMGGMKNAVSWTSMINACSDNGLPAEAFQVFEEMRLAGVEVDEVTLLAVISACTRLDCASGLGDWMEERAFENGFFQNTRVANALIHIHGKMGRVRRSCEIFDSMSVRTVVSWTAVIQALAMDGHGVAAVVRFSQMLRQGFQPDEVIFLSVINACCHSRLVSEGRQLFKSMVEEYHITPWMEHYGSMVDLLCKAGVLDEAFEFVLAMPVKPDPVIWRVLARACRDHGNASLARKVIDHVINMEPDHEGNYVLASNLYALDEDWRRVVDVRLDMGVRKRASRCSSAVSYVEVNDE